MVIQTQLDREGVRCIGVPPVHHFPIAHWFLRVQKNRTVFRPIRLHLGKDSKETSPSGQLEALTAGFKNRRNGQMYRRTAPLIETQ